MRENALRETLTGLSVAATAAPPTVMSRSPFGHPSNGPHAAAAPHAPPSNAAGTAQLVTPIAAPITSHVLCQEIAESTQRE